MRTSRPAFVAVLMPPARLVLLAVVMAAGRAEATPFAYLPAGSSLAVVDTATDTVTATVPGVGGVMNAVAVNSAGTRVYVGGSAAGVTVVDATTNTKLTDLAFAGSASAVALNPAGTRLYVMIFLGGVSPNQVVVVDTATHATLATVTVQQSGAPSMAVNPAGTKLYVPNLISGTVSVIDTATNTVVATIPAVRARTVAFNPSGTRAYVAGASPANLVTVIDTSTETVVTTIPITAGADGVAVNAAGTRLYVTRQLSSSLAVVDTASNSVLTNVALSDGCTGLSPHAIALTPDGSRAYFLAAGCSGTAAWIFDTATNALTGSVPMPASGTNGYGLYIGPFCPGACSDGNPCTTDSCNPVGGCTYSNNTGPCADDGNACTNDVCDGAGSCAHPAAASGTPCDDGAFCNGADSCDGAGACDHAGDPCAGGPECAVVCNEASDDCFDPGGTPCTDDGNVCTDDTCDGAGACAHPDNAAPCDDGLFCNGTDSCGGGSCLHTGDPCAGNPECADACNETADDCFDPAGTACTSDADVCTLDQCDGVGACAHPAGNAGTVCRSSAGDCDLAESCDGLNPGCPTDGFLPSTTECRADAGDCDVAESCTGSSADCPADGSEPDGTACTDDGDVCTTDACQGGVCGHVLNGVCLDDFNCYGAKVSRETPKFEPVLGLPLSDQFETGPFDVKAVKNLCAPADPAGALLDADTHLEHYKIKLPLGQPVHVPRRVLVTSQLGAQVVALTLDTKKAESLLVPTAKSLVGDPTPPDNEAHEVDHFKCYSVRFPRGFPKLPRGLQVTVQDQFTSPAKVLDVKSFKRLCTPVDKNGEGIKNPDRHLACYKVKPALGQPLHVPRLGVYVHDQFGALRNDTKKEDLYCVPATKALVP